MNILISEIREIILEHKNKAVRSVNFSRVLMYHTIGRVIVTDLQKNKDRSDYGSKLLQGISDDIVPEYGSGFSKRMLELTRQFYRIFPNANTLYSQLNWSQYRLLIRIENYENIQFSISKL